MVSDVIQHKLILAPDRLHIKIEVFPVKTGDNDLRIPELEHAGNVRFHLFRSRCGKCADNGTDGKMFDKIHDL